MLALCARYQLRAVGVAMKDIQSPIVGEEGSPTKPPERAMASHPSRRSRSFTARHQGLPGGDASSESRTPRSACQRIDDIAARL
jgi:hypothetical protein